MRPCPKQDFTRCPEYLRSAIGRFCDVPGCPHNSDTVVAAHIRPYSQAGANRKPPDDEVLFLCAIHHDEFDMRQNAHDDGGAWWILENIVKPKNRLRFQQWKALRPEVEDKPKSKPQPKRKARKGRGFQKHPTLKRGVDGKVKERKNG